MNSPYRGQASPYLGNSGVVKPGNTPNLPQQYQGQVLYAQPNQNQNQSRMGNQFQGRPTVYPNIVMNNSGGSVPVQYANDYSQRAVQMNGRVIQPQMTQMGKQQPMQPMHPMQPMQQAQQMQPMMGYPMKQQMNTPSQMLPHQIQQGGGQSMQVRPSTQPMNSLGTPLHPDPRGLSTSNQLPELQQPKYTPLAQKNIVLESAKQRQEREAAAWFYRPNSLVTEIEGVQQSERSSELFKSSLLMISQQFVH